MENFSPVQSHTAVGRNISIYACTHGMRQIRIVDLQTGIIYTVLPLPLLTANRKLANRSVI